MSDDDVGPTLVEETVGPVDDGVDAVRVDEPHEGAQVGPGPDEWEAVTCCSRCGRPLAPGELWGDPCRGSCPGWLKNSELRPIGRYPETTQRVVVVVGDKDLEPNVGPPSVTHPGSVFVDGVRGGEA